jgi:hypothetical protein
LLEDRRLLSGGRWKQLASPAPGPISTMILLSNGTVMAQDGSRPTMDHKLPAAAANWYQLASNRKGSYIHGRWSLLAPMHTPRRFYASDLLPSGDLFVAGGEDTNAGDTNGERVEANSGELYNPNTNTWTSIATFPRSKLGDAPSEVLPDGQVLAGFIRGPQTYAYNTTTNQWSQSATKLDGDSSAEETWVKLPDGSILSYDVAASIASGTSQAQRYLPSQNRWVSAGVLPIPLSSDDVGHELGPAFLLPDGRVFFLGGNSNTALYSPSSDGWIGGPEIPGDLAAADAPGAMLPNGRVLFAASIALQHGQARPTELFDFNPVKNRIELVHTPNALTQSLDRMAANRLRMLLLPSGQLLLSDGTTQLWVYTPSGSPKRSWRPTIRGIRQGPEGVFTLTGRRLNGISEGAAYGDDAQMATNYPIVQLKDPNHGTLVYARTFDWSSTSVDTGRTLETTRFTLPRRLRAGLYRLSVVASGVASSAVSFRMR